MSNRSSRVLPDLSALQAQLDALKAENEALKAASTKATRVEITEYQGRPTLHFQGNFKPFHAGMSKLKAIMELETQVKTFIASEGKKI